MVAVYDQASSEADIRLPPHSRLRDTAQAAKYRDQKPAI